MNKEQLINQAKAARKNAYTPYSAFPVGAALLAHSGEIYTGCNIENAAYPVTCCAERVSIFAAVAQGETTFKEMAIIADTPRPVSPCGSCRQVMSEFFDADTVIHMANLNGDITTASIDKLLPFSFDATDLS